MKWVYTKRPTLRQGHLNNTFRYLVACSSTPLPILCTYVHDEGRFIPHGNSTIEQNELYKHLKNIYAWMPYYPAPHAYQTRKEYDKNWYLKSSDGKRQAKTMNAIKLGQRVEYKGMIGTVYGYNHGEYVYVKYDNKPNYIFDEGRNVDYRELTKLFTFCRLWYLIKAKYKGKLFEFDNFIGSYRFYILGVRVYKD